MLLTKKSRVAKFLDATRSYIVGVDTPVEVRAHTGYRFIVGIGDELTALGIPGSMSFRAASRIHVALPDNFHHDYEDEFVELVHLWSKSIFVTYQTLKEDFHEDIVDDMFLSMVNTIRVEFSFE